MKRRSSRSLAGSPLLIGAVTTLVVIVAVFLSYNANNGLPFVPTYDIKVQVPDASSLQVGNDVRIGGTRVGQVSAEAPYQDPHTGAVNAVLTLKLEKRVEPLPAATTVIVRDRSALGEKYLELSPHPSAQTIAPGATLPLSAATPEPVQIDQVLNMFDAPTRAAEQTNIAAYGDAFAGRGGNLNNTISNLAPALASAEPLSRTLAAAKTNLVALFPALERGASQVAPVADQQAQLFVDLDTTFKALAGVAPSIGQSIAGSPASLDQATYSLVYLRPFTSQLTRFFTLLAPGAVALRDAAPSLSAAVAAGARNLAPAVALNQRLSTSLAALQTFAQDPQVSQGLQDLTLTASGGEPIVSDLAGMQLTCNYPTLALRNVASIAAEGDNIGTWLRLLPIVPQTLFNPFSFPQGAAGDAVDPPNNEGSSSSAPANQMGSLGAAQPPRSVTPGSTSAGQQASTAAALLVAQQANHLHNTPYPFVGAPGQPAGKCEAGNQVYASGQTVIGHAAQISSGRDLATNDG